MRILSDIPLSCPTLQQPTSKTISIYQVSRKDLEAHYDTTTEGDKPSSEPVYRQYADGSHYVRWDGVGEFMVSPTGSDIALHTCDTAPWETVQSYLLTQALSFAVLNAGHEPLHATAVMVEGRTVAFLGDSGWGKSTIAAACLRAGHQLLTDDLLLLMPGHQAGEPFIAQPGPPRLKLFPDVSQRVLPNHRSSCAMNPLTDKLIFHLLPEQHCPTASPLHALYLLRPMERRAEMSRVMIRPVGVRRALLELLAHSYNSMVSTPDRLQRHFLFVGQIVQRVPVRSLSFRRDFDNLPSVVAAIRRDMAA